MSKTINCSNCTAELSQKLPICPQCGHPNKKASYLSGWFVFSTLAAVCAVIWWLAGGGVDLNRNKPVYVQPRETASSSPNTRPVTATDEALGLCMIFKGTGLTTHCEITASIPSVDVTIDTSGAEARKMCLGLSDMLAKQKNQFAGKWELRIFSPYSGEKAIAVCSLK